MKKHKLIVKEDAKAELVNAYNFYETKSIGLGEKFLTILDYYFDIIILNPKIYPVKYKNVRQATIKAFPFVILFEIEKNTILIYSIFHTSRKPKSF